MLPYVHAKQSPLAATVLLVSYVSNVHEPISALATTNISPAIISRPRSSLLVLIQHFRAQSRARNVCGLRIALRPPYAVPYKPEGLGKACTLETLKIPYPSQPCYFGPHEIFKTTCAVAKEERNATQETQSWLDCLCGLPIRLMVLVVSRI